MRGSPAASSTACGGDVLPLSTRGSGSAGRRRSIGGVHCASDASALNRESPARRPYAPESPRSRRIQPDKGTSAFIQRRSWATPADPTRERRRCAAPFRYGASRTRTGDLLGAIQAGIRQIRREKMVICRRFAQLVGGATRTDSGGYLPIPSALRHSRRLVPETPATDPGGRWPRDHYGNGGAATGANTPTPPPPTHAFRAP